MVLWLGTLEDKEFDNVTSPGRLDWGEPIFRFKGNPPHLCPSREQAWQRIQIASGSLLTSDLVQAGAIGPEKYLESLKLHTRVSVAMSGGWTSLGTVDLWIHLQHLRSEFAAVQRLLTQKSQSQAKTGNEPRQPAAVFMDAAGLTEALGLAETDMEKVSKSLARHYQDNKSCGSAIDVPRKGEPRMVYRVSLVWPHLLEQLERWNPPSELS